MLIDKDAAAEYREKTKPVSQTAAATQLAGGSNVPPSVSGDSPVTPLQSVSGGVTTPAIQTAIKKQFYGNIDLDPVKAKMDFATIVDEVVQQFTAKLGVEVSISVEIQAKSKDGFDESLQRTIKENCNVLRFSSSEFEEEFS